MCLLRRHWIRPLRVRNLHCPTHLGDHREICHDKFLGDHRDGLGNEDSEHEVDESSVYEADTSEGKSGTTVRLVK